MWQTVKIGSGVNDERKTKKQFSLFTHGAWIKKCTLKKDTKVNDKNIEKAPKQLHLYLEFAYKN